MPRSLMHIIIISHLFSPDEATLYKGVSVRQMVRWSVTSYFFSLLGANYAVYMALLNVFNVV